MIYILVIWLYGGSFALTVPPPFPSLPACEQAGAAWDKSQGVFLGGGAHHVCLPHQIGG